MRTKDLSPKRFALLSAIRRQSLTPTECRARLHWSSSPADFFNVQEALVRLGLVRKLSKGSNVKLLITPAGKSTWREAADFYLQLIEMADSDNPSLVASQNGDVPAPPPARSPRRLPTRDEFTALQHAATERERLTWDVLRATLLPVNTLFALDVADVGRTLLTLRKAGERPQAHPLDAPLRHCLIASIGDRSNGPALLTEDGTRWTYKDWQKDWRKLRQRAGVPNFIIPRIRPGPYGKLPGTVAAITHTTNR